MLQLGCYVFKLADTDREFEQIHRLNYRTFVDEIPQHSDPGTGKLVDKFHHKNLYFVVLKRGRLVGMLSAHDQPPFSVADRLTDPTILDKPDMRPLEVRLLAIEPTERNSNLFFGLIWTLYEYAQKTEKTHLIISGVAQRLRLYERLGFVAVGPSVRSGNASFVPMMLTVGNLPGKVQRVKRLWESHIEQLLGQSAAGEWDDDSLPTPPLTEETGDEPPPRALCEAEICLLPGPVTMSPAVRQAFAQPPIYHRGPAFIQRFHKIRARLGELVGAREVAILNGSGTLANETVAATLSALGCPGRGVLLVNGEFGGRLVRQAARFGLHPTVLSWPWGKPWDLEQVDQALSCEPQGSWVWGVHQESSSGVLNDLPGLVRIAKKHGVRVCVDCISSLGAVPLDLSEVFLATGSSGKALGSYAGAALVFADPAVNALVDRARVPSYFDLASALEAKGPCYTFPSPLLLALETALEPYATPEQAQAVFARYAELGRYVRQRLRRLDLTPLAEEEHACPVLTTFTPPGGESSTKFVERCLSWGIALGGQSGYLAERRLVQIATMGAATRQMCDVLFERLERWLAKRQEVAEVLETVGAR
jgi:aspartate aminotransferase-like enzyme